MSECTVFGEDNGFLQVTIVPRTGDDEDRYGEIAKAAARDHVAKFMKQNVFVGQASVNTASNNGVTTSILYTFDLFTVSALEAMQEAVDHVRD